MVYAVRFDGESKKSCEGLKAILSKFTNKVIDRFDARRLDLSELLFQGVWMLVKHYS